MRLSTAVLFTLILTFAASMVLRLRQINATCANSLVGKFQLSIGTDNQTGTAMLMKDGQAVTQISDGQPHGVSQIVDGQPQAITIADGQTQVPHNVSQISDGQPRTVTQIPDGQPQSTKTKREAACVSGFLILTLEKGALNDQDGRFGYIAGGNNQFQFDNPVQAGGYGENDFSVCANGTIAFRGSTDWWKCDSGAGFYNLYDAEISPDACQPCKFLALTCA